MNNSRNRILIFLVVFLVLTNVSMLLYFTVYNKSFGKQGHGDRRGPGITAFLQNEVGFNKAQMEKLDTLKRQHRALIKPLFDDLGKSKDDFYQLLGKTGVTDETLQTAAGNIGQKQAAVDLQFFKNFISIRNVCTPQQLLKFNAVMPSLAAKMMQPWQKNNARKKEGDSLKTKN